jgi:predicted O-methyltransferase YrrM
MKQIIRNIIKNTPGLKKVYTDYFLHKENSCFPAGHFYSPIVFMEEAKGAEKLIWQHEEDKSIAGINLNVDQQLSLLDEFKKYYSDLPFKDVKSEGLRYFFNNEYYAHADGIVLYSVMRHFNPKRIIEIGSGFSSALMLDVSDRFHHSNLTFIEPYPDRLNSLLMDTDSYKVRIIVDKVQNVDLSVFKELEAGDILFADSSHISKTGSDLNHILFEILPQLKSGVLIHFHDIFYPFEYPREWVFGGRNWNEAYLLRAFLMSNNEYSIEFFTSFILKHHRDKLDAFPDMFKNSGASFWLKKR